MFGDRKARKRIETQLSKTPLYLNGRNITQVNILWYLGDMVTHNLEDSVHQTIMKRVGLLKH